MICSIQYHSSARYRTMPCEFAIVRLVAAGSNRKQFPRCCFVDNMQSTIVLGRARYLLVSRTHCSRVVRSNLQIEAVARSRSTLSTIVARALFALALFEVLPETFIVQRDIASSIILFLGVFLALKLLIARVLLRRRPNRERTLACHTLWKDLEHGAHGSLFGQT